LKKLCNCVGYLESSCRSDEVAATNMAGQRQPTTPECGNYWYQCCTFM